MTVKGTEFLMIPRIVAITSLCHVKFSSFTARKLPKVTKNETLLTKPIMGLHVAELK
jgi:hypothetical protein